MADPGEGDESEDRPSLTQRDIETLHLAASMGYYESPRRCRMEDIANELGISKSAVYHRMNKVEREAITWFLERLGVQDPGALDPEDQEELEEQIPETFEEWLEAVDEEDMPGDSEVLPSED